MLLYMRRVHGFCLFCGIHSRDERQLAVKCSVQHLRNARTVSKKEFDGVEYTESKQFHQNVIRKANQILE